MDVWTYERKGSLVTLLIDADDPDYKNGGADEFARHPYTNLASHGTVEILDVDGGEPHMLSTSTSLEG